MKRPIQVEIGAFAFSNTPILQYSMQRAIFTTKTIYLLPRFKNQVFDVELVSLTFFAASGYPATAGPIIAHLGNQMVRTSFFWAFAGRGYRNGKHRVGRHTGNS